MKYCKKGAFFSFKHRRKNGITIAFSEKKKPYGIQLNFCTEIIKYRLVKKQNKTKQNKTKQKKTNKQTNKQTNKSKKKKKQ